MAHSPRQWVRRAGSRRYHLERSIGDSRYRTAVCGAPITHYWVYWVPAADGSSPIPARQYVRLAQYPRRYGFVSACAHCARIFSKEVR